MTLVGLDGRCVFSGRQVQLGATPLGPTSPKVQLSAEQVAMQIRAFMYENGMNGISPKIPSKPRSDIGKNNAGNNPSFLDFS